MSGSENNDEVIDYFTYVLAEEVGIKHIWHQEVEVPNWGSRSDESHYESI